VFLPQVNLSVLDAARKQEQSLSAMLHILLIESTSSLSCSVILRSPNGCMDTSAVGTLLLAIGSA
jgi:hypothetical protein